MTKRQNIALICVIAVIAVVLFAVGGYFIDTYASSDGERRSDGFVYSVSGNTATISAYEGEDTTLTIPARIAGRRVALIEEGFLDNTSVTEVIFSEDITMIELEEGVFEDNTKLTYVSLPDSLKEIPERAFEDCTGLVRVKLPSSLEKIGASAFEGCSNLETSGASGEKQRRVQGLRRSHFGHDRHRSQGHPRRHVRQLRQHQLAHFRRGQHR